MDQPLQKMSAFFNERAPIYDEVHVGHVGGGLESKHVIASFLPAHTETLLDLGIGTGLELEGIFGRFPDIEITGLDIAEDMLQLLRGKYPGKHIELHCASYFDFDLGRSLYDVALAVMTLHHYDHETKTALYRRIHDCIRPGGVYIECDFMLSEDEYGDAQATEDLNFSEFARLKKEQGLTDGIEYHYDTPCTVPNQKQMLSAAGFVNVEEVWRKGNTVILVAGKT